MRIATDTGGTFTDLVVEDADGLRLFKAPTTPEDPVDGLLDAVDRVAATSIRRTVEPRRAGDPDALVADNRAILARLDWKPMLDNLDTIVSHALAWERQLDERRAAA